VSRNKEVCDMAYFTARILSKDGVVITDDIEVWIHFFLQSTYRLQLTDGRAGLITDIVTQLRGDNIAMYFEGKGPLQ
jgi:hypothetical protein